MSLGEAMPPPPTSFSGRDPEDEVPSRYRVHLLCEAGPAAHGVVYRQGEERRRVPWERVRRAQVALVGEPQGVRTVVFDLVVRDSGPECVALRFDADPGAEAQAVAQALLEGLGKERCGPALRELAGDGSVPRSYPDLASLDEANLESVRFG
jgi:hypothetical protein